MATRPDQVFGTGAGENLYIDVYEAEGVSQRTAVIMLHGGGWRRGDRTRMQAHAKALASLGFTCLAAQYRLLDAHPWPAPIEDVKAAIRWTRAHAAELGIAEDRIVLFGQSAGAHLALLAAGTPDAADFAGSGGNAGLSERVNGIVAVYAPVRFAVHPEGTDAAAATLLGGGAAVEGARRISPISHVAAGFPPTLLVHGDADRVVPLEHSLDMYRALREAGVAAELHISSGQPHGFANVPAQVEVLAREAALFLRRTVSDVERTAAESAAYEVAPVAR